MNKEDFKKRWESDGSGGGITFGDIADCAKSWKISSTPYTQDMHKLTYQILLAANCEDANDWLDES